MDTNDNLIKLEALEKEYETVLKQYQDTLNSYIASLQEPKTYTALSGRAFWGQSALNGSTVSSQDDCTNMCVSDNKCTGATYNSKTNYCWTRQGQGTLSVAKDDDYAIILKTQSLLMQLNHFNDKLTNLSKEFMTELQQIKPIIDEQKNINQEKQNNVKIYYINLTNQKKEIEKQLEEYKTIQNEYENQQIYATQKNMSLYFWILLGAIILLITIKKMVGSDSLPLNIIFYFGLTILLVIFSYGLSKPAGFTMWLIFFMYLFLSFIGIL